jgi:hypothetical protein
MLIHGLDDLQIIYKTNTHSNHLDPDKIALQVMLDPKLLKQVHHFFMLLVQGWATCGVWWPGHFYFEQIAPRTPCNLAQKLLTMLLICVYQKHTRMVTHRDVVYDHVNGRQTKHLIMTSPRDVTSVNTRTSYPLPRTLYRSTHSPNHKTEVTADTYCDYRSILHHLHLQFTLCGVWVR